MKTLFHLLAVFSASLLLAACSPARTGVVNGTLTTNVRPAVSISANAPFVLADSGRLWLSPVTNAVPGLADASFDYAVYTDPSVSPASRFAYAAIIRLQDMETWNFTPQRSLPGAFGAKQRTARIAHGGFMYTLHVPSGHADAALGGDWASDLLAANGVTPPSAWIAKRWVYDVDRGARAIAEYREPWPADLDVPEEDLLLVGSEDLEFLRDFERRALAAFSMTADIGDFPGIPETRTAWKRPASLPDAVRLAGDIVYAVSHDAGTDYD